MWTGTDEKTGVIPIGEYPLAVFKAMKAALEDVAHDRLEGAVHMVLRQKGTQVKKVCPPLANCQIHPVRSDVADRPQRAALPGLNAPAVIGVVQQPVLP